MLPPIHEPVNAAPNMDRLHAAHARFSHTPIRVKVVQCDYNTNAWNKGSKLKHNAAPSDRGLDMGLDNTDHYQSKLPVIFEPNAMKLSKGLKEKLLSDQLDDKNAEILYIGDLSDDGGSKQGHIVVHANITGYAPALIEDQRVDIDGHKYDQKRGQKRTDKKTYQDKILQFLEVPEFKTAHHISNEKEDKSSSTESRTTYCQKENIVSKSTQVSFSSLDESADKINATSEVKTPQTTAKQSVDDNVQIEYTNTIKKRGANENNEFYDHVGRKIWEEVDAMIKRSIPNGSLWKYNRKSDDLVDQVDEEPTLNSIELHPRFKRRGTERFHFEPADHMWDLYGTNADTGKHLSEFRDRYRDFITTNNKDFFGYDPLLQRTNPEAMTLLAPRQDFIRTYGNADWIREQPFMSSSILDQHPYNVENVKYLRFGAPVQKSSSAPISHQMAHRECNTRTKMMATSLPRLTPSSTPLPTGITQPPPRSHSSTAVYVPYPPNNLSSSSDFANIPQRINPLKPPPPRKRINWSWETVDQHHENEKRRLLMQKREHTRYHSAWSKAFYGAPAEKEAYRRHFRETLKQQMDDRDTMKKGEFNIKIKESERALAYDRQCQQNDASEFYRKHNYLCQFRDGNKQQMEDRWAQVRTSKHVEDRIDRERLRYNPINWSCSLK